MENTNTKDNKKIIYIMIVIAIALLSYISYIVIQNNNKNINNTNTMNQNTTDLRISEAGDVIVIDYSGKLEDGTEFDSSYKRGQPFIFQVGVGQVIQGWDEGLIGVKRGDKKTLTITSDKAYGDQDIKDQTGKIIIPKNSTLIFDVEVIDVISRADAERMMAEQQAANNSATTTE